MPGAELWSRFTCELRRLQAIQLHFRFKAKNELGRQEVSVERRLEDLQPARPHSVKAARGMPRLC
jgi:hypothetical protein